VPEPYKEASEKKLIRRYGDRWDDNIKVEIRKLLA
jgi:hypothetical protein